MYFFITKPLKPLTWYALVLLHSNHRFDDCIYEDLLIPFQTEASNNNNNNVNSNNNKLECCVCMDKQSSIVYLPCGHICCCNECDLKVQGICPKCRVAIQAKHKVFFN